MVQHRLFQVLVVMVAGLLGAPAVARAQVKAPPKERPAGAEKTLAPLQKGPDHGAEVDNVRQPAPDESIYIVQNRAYSKSGKFEVSTLFFTAVNPKFVGYWGAGVAASYHIQENLALEFFSAAHPVGAFYSDLVYEVWKYENLTPLDVDLKQILYFNSLSILFSALYGKLEFYGYLVDYDFFVTGGVGYALTRETCQPGSSGCTKQAVDIGRGLRLPDRGMDAHKITGNLGFGTRIFFHEMVGARIEFRNIVFSDRKTDTVGASGTPTQTSTDIRNTMMLILGASFLFG